MFRKGFNALICVLMFFTCGNCLAVGNTDLGDGFVNVVGAPYTDPRLTTGTCSAAADATLAIQTKIDAVSLAGGGVVYLPTGRYCIYGTLYLNHNVTLKGVFEAPAQSRPDPFPIDHPSGSPGPDGTVLLAMGRAGSAGGEPLIRVIGFGAGINGIAVWYPDQVIPVSGPWTPIIYPWTIIVDMPDASIQNVLLLNPVRGILVNNGRVFINGLYGQPLINGLQIHNSLDTSRISNVHFWPFWDHGLSQVVRNYTRQYAIAIISEHTDAQMMSNIFSISYFAGLAFNRSQIENGGAPNVVLSNIAIDDCKFGILMYDSGIGSISISNLHVAVTVAGGSGVYGAMVDGATANLLINNYSVNSAGNDFSAVTWNNDGTLVLNGARVINMGVSPSVNLLRGKITISGAVFPTQTAGTAINIGSLVSKSIVVGNILSGHAITNLSPGAVIANNSP